MSGRHRRGEPLLWTSITKGCRRLVLAAALGCCSTVTAKDVWLSTFDGAADTTQGWFEVGDVSMGGTSSSSAVIDQQTGVLAFRGVCALVPGLQAPGFVSIQSSGAIPSAKGCHSLVFSVSSDAPYSGFRVSFGNGHYPGGKFFAVGFKSELAVPLGNFSDVALPFAGFSSDWDDATGDIITRCMDDFKACPTESDLAMMEPISIWAQGVEGQFTLSVKSIRATGCEEKNHEEPLA